jgi:hypothetical protein
MMRSALLKLAMMMALTTSVTGCTKKLNPSAVDQLSAQEFASLFPRKNSFYSYSSFVDAVHQMSKIKIEVERRGDWIYKITRTTTDGKDQVVRKDKDWDEPWAKKMPYSDKVIDYSTFCSESNTGKKELAAFFAHIAHETRNGVNGAYNDGLMLTHELDTNSVYVVPNKIYTEVPGKKYYGRGPLQLSYNGNYGAASEVIYGAKNILLEKPEILEKDPIISFESAIYFWMTPQAKKPSAHEVLAKDWSPNDLEQKAGYKAGFGMTINIINGAVECNQGDNQSGMKDRIGFYQYFLKRFKAVDKDCVCACSHMAPYGS